MNLNEEINKKAISWLNREKEGLNEYEQNQLLKWVNDNKHHKQSYEYNKQLREACINLPKDYLEQLSLDAKTGAKRTKVIEKTKPYILSAMVLMIIFISSMQIVNYNNPIYSKIYTTKNTNLLNIKLPESSIIDLNVKSSLTINLFKNKREVLLHKGKAVFSVQKDKERPFIITSGKTTIEVVGTKFEVININDETKVNVIEGIVKIGHIYNKNKDSKTISLLKKGDSLNINNEGKVLNLNRIVVNNIAAWTNNILIFNKTTLIDAMKSFERYTNKKTKFENSHLAHLEITGNFSTTEFNKFLNALPIIYPIKIAEKADNIQILEKN